MHSLTDHWYNDYHAILHMRIFTDLDSQEHRMQDDRMNDMLTMAVQKVEKELETINKLNSDFEKIKQSYEKGWLGAKKGKKTLYVLTGLTFVGMTINFISDILSAIDDRYDTPSLKLSSLIINVIGISLLTGISYARKIIGKAEKEITQLSTTRKETAEHLHQVRHFLEVLKVFLQTKSLETFQQCILLLKTTPFVYVKQKEGRLERLISFLIQQLPGDCPLIRQVEKTYQLAGQLQQKMERGCEEEKKEEEPSRKEPSRSASFICPSGRVTPPSALPAISPTSLVAASEGIKAPPPIQLPVAMQGNISSAEPEEGKKTGTISLHVFERQTHLVELNEVTPTRLQRGDMATEQQVQGVNSSPLLEGPSSFFSRGEAKSQYAREFSTLICMLNTLPLEFIEWRGRRLGLELLNN